MDQIESLFNIVGSLCEERHQLRRGVIHSSDWSQSNEKIELIFPVSIGLRKLIEHLSCTLRMSNVSDFLVSSMLSYIINLCWSIEVSHFSPAELPVGPVVFWVQSLMTRAILGASLVSKPNIIALIDQLEGWSYVRPMHNPTISRVDNSMLQENSLSTWLRVFGINSVNI